MKKLLTGMLTAVMAVTLFAGCSPASSQKGEEITDKWADIEKRGRDWMIPLFPWDIKTKKANLQDLMWSLPGKL